MAEARAQVPQSPPPAATFQAILKQEIFNAPDASGAVGEDRVIASVNSRLRVQEKTGNPLGAEEPFSTFWSSINVQHSRIVYYPDPVAPDNSMWVLAAADTTTNQLLLAVFKGRYPHPSTNWTGWRKKFDLPLPGFTPDFVNIGFNRHWVAVQVSDAGSSSRLYVFNRLVLRDGAPATWTPLQVFNLTSAEGLTSASESPAPALTYDTNEPDLYLVRVKDRSTGTVRLLKVTSASPPSSPFLQGVSDAVLPEGAWAENITDPAQEAPQLQTLATTWRIETGDDRVQNVVVDESGEIWAANTVFLTGPRSAVQFWAVRADGALLRSGRVDDAAGRRFFAYPQIAVSTSRDALVGYSAFSPLERATAAYSLLVRQGDGSYVRRGDRMLLAGSELAVFGSCSPSCASSWGRYGTVARDPAGPDLWMLQEVPVPTALFPFRAWETWWGRVDPRPWITVADASASEPPDGVSPPGQARFMVVLSWPTSQEVRVDVVTNDGSATAPADYGGVSSFPLVFAPGETQRWVDVPVYYDGACETSETFTLRLDNPVNAWLGETHVASLVATGTITENPPPPTITIQDARVVEGTGGAAWDLALTVAASAEPCAATSVTYSTRQGSAQLSTDFTNATGVLAFGPSLAVSQTLNVPIVQDSDPEGDEEFYVDLSFSGPAYATLARTSGVVTIRDDDDGADYPAVGFLTLTSDSVDSGATARHRLRWRNPMKAGTLYVRVRWRDTGLCPSDGPATCSGDCHEITSTVTNGVPEVGSHDSSSLDPAIPYCYKIWVGNDPPTISGANKIISAEPFDTTAARWRFGATAGSSLGSPSIGNTSILALLGDELHAAVRDPASLDAGTWPPGWRPVRLGSLDQVRFPTLPVGGRWRAFIATNTGRVFSVDADTGGVLWTSDLAAAPWNTQTGAPAAGMFRQFGGSRDVLLVGSRKSAATNSLLALDPFTGVVLHSYALTGTTGLITTAPIVDYAARRVYFTSYDSSPTNANLYCLRLSDTGAPFAATNPAWKVTVPTATDGPPATMRERLTTSPILRNGRIYVGDAKGVVYSVRASDGGDIRRLDTATGSPVPGFLFPDRSGDALYFTTGNRVYKVHDSDAGGLVATGEVGWPVSIDPTATMPLFYRRQTLPGFAWTATGGAGPTRVFRVEGGSAVEVADLGLSDTPGQPTLDSAFAVMHLGTTAGSLFAVQVNLP